MPKKYECPGSIQQHLERCFALWHQSNFTCHFLVLLLERFRVMPLVFSAPYSWRDIEEISNSEGNSVCKDWFSNASTDFDKSEFVRKNTKVSRTAFLFYRNRPSWPSQTLQKLPIRLKIQSNATHRSPGCKIHDRKNAFSALYVNILRDISTEKAENREFLGSEYLWKSLWKSDSCYRWLKIISVRVVPLK